MSETGSTAYESTPFGVRLRAAMSTHGPLCAGIDPHVGLLQQWGLSADLDGLRAFTEACVEAFAGQVACVKPQSAFFEVFGSRGVAVLEEAVDALRAAGTLVILDAKRGDIGTTMDAYAEAFLGKDAPSPTDALTEKSVIELGMPTRSVQTTCADCGVGCAFKAEVQGTGDSTRVVRMMP